MTTASTPFSICGLGRRVAPNRLNTGSLRRLLLWIAPSACAFSPCSGEKAALIATWGASTSAPSELLPALSRAGRSEEHTSELQSQSNLVCRLLLEKKKNKKY